MNDTETRHPEECDIWGELSIYGHYYYYDKSRYTEEFDNLVNREYKKRKSVDYFHSEKEVIEYFSSRIKVPDIFVKVSSCTKGTPYRKSKKPYRSQDIKMLKVSFFHCETEVAYVILAKG